MVTYHKMTFSTTGGTGTNTPISQQQAQRAPTYYAPSYYSPAQKQDIYYSQQTYQQYQTYNPTPQQRASTPSTPTRSTPSTSSKPPVVAGKSTTYQTAADIGAIGDTKTVLMKDGTYRNYTRIGKDSFVWEEVDSSGKVLSKGSGDGTGSTFTNTVSTPLPAPSPSKPNAAPTALMYVSGHGTVTSDDVPGIGDVYHVSLPDGGARAIRRTSANNIDYQDYDKDGYITTPWTPIYEETPSSTSSGVSPKLSPVKSALTVATQALAYSKPVVSNPIPDWKVRDKPDFSTLIKPVADVTIQAAPVYAGSPDWSKTNEGGDAFVISEVDYLALFGVSAFGKWLAKKFLAAITKDYQLSNSKDALDKLKDKLSRGEIDQYEFNDIWDEIADSLNNPTGIDLVKYRISRLLELIRSLNQNGDVTQAYTLALATRNAAYGAANDVVFEPEYKEVQDIIDSTDDSSVDGSVLVKQGYKEDSVLHVLAAGSGDEKNSDDEFAKGPSEEETEEKDEEWVPDWLKTAAKNGLNVVKDYVGMGDYDDPLPSSDRGVVGGGVEDPVSPTTEVTSSAPTTPTTSKIETADPFAYEKSASSVDLVDEDVLDVGVPLTGEDVNTVVLDWLNKKYPNQAGVGGNNELLTKYFGSTIPGMSQNGVDLGSLADTARQYENLMKGDVMTSGDQSNVQSAIISFNKKMINNNIPAGAIAAFNAGLYSKLHDTPGYSTVGDWMLDGGIKHALENDTLFLATTGIDEFVKSEEGSAAIGLAFSTIGTIGAFMAAGPFGAMASSGTTVFTVTELFGMLGANPFKTKANLQLLGDYAPDEVKKWATSYTDAGKMVDAVSMTKNTNDPALNLKRLKDADTALKNTENEYKKSAFYQLASGSAVVNGNNLVDLRNRYTNLKADYDEQGNFLGGNVHPRQLIATNIPEGVKVTWNQEESYGKEHDFSYVRGAITSVVSAIMPDGTVIPLKEQKVSSYDPDNPQIDVGALIALKQSYGGSGSSKVTTGKTTVYLPPGVSFSYEGKNYVGGSGGSTYDIQRQSGAPLRLTFEAEGKKPLTEYIGFPETGWNSYSVPDDLKGSTTSPPIIEGFHVDLYEGQKFILNGLEANKYIDEDGDVAVPWGAGKYDVRILNPDGSTAYHNPDEYVGAGKFVALPLTTGEDPKPPYQQRSYGSGGGGGGGSSGGGGGGDSSYAPKPEEETLIVYGPTCKDAELWQDEIQVYPEIDEPYSISPGYHSIKAIREGKKPWLKTVFCASGDTITVSPAFEDLGSSSEPTEPLETGFPKRVFINSDPSGGLVLVNGASSGEWTPCYLDLPEGYYTFTIKKSGYDPYDILCYVGEIIAWNNQAMELATSRGWL